MPALLLTILLSGGSLGASSLSCSECLAVASEAEGSARLELRRQLSLVDDRIEHVDTRWPRGAKLMTLGGAVLTPLLVVTSWFVMLTGAFPGTPPDVRRWHLVAAALVLFHAVVTLTGLILGIVKGLSANREAREEKIRLLEERARIKRELEELSRGGSSPRSLPLLGVLTFRF